MVTVLCTQHRFVNMFGGLMSSDSACFSTDYSHDQGFSQHLDVLITIEENVTSDSLSVYLPVLLKMLSSCTVSYQNQ